MVAQVRLCRKSGGLESSSARWYRLRAAGKVGGRRSVRSQERGGTRDQDPGPRTARTQDGRWAVDGRMCRAGVKLDT